MKYIIQDYSVLDNDTLCRIICEGWHFTHITCGKHLHDRIIKRAYETSLNPH